MKLELRAAAATLALAWTLPAAAQEAPAVVPNASLEAAEPSPVMLTKGTAISLVTLTQLNSEFAKVGQNFELEVVEDVMVDGRIAIARGTRAKGVVTFVQKKGGWGKSGKIDAKVVSLTANGVEVPVDGAVGDKGRKGTGALVGAVFFSPLIVAPFTGFFVTGTSAVLPFASPAHAVLVSDLTVPPAPEAAQPN